MVVKIAILGLGQRGLIYANYAKSHPDEFEITAITDNDPRKITVAKEQFTCPVFSDYKDFLSADIQADIVVVSTQDIDHPEHAVACMEKGYDLLLEKPIAPTLEGCNKISAAAKRLNRNVIVCHVLRYTAFYSKLKELITAGKVGDIITVHASENVGYHHQAHSFVRGPWRNSKESSPMILAKCCHDMDILRWLIDKKCHSVCSFGSLSVFRPERAPKGHTAYCSDCPLDDCIYKAQTLYPNYHWEAKYFTDSNDDKEILKALTHSQYDRCVYASDNDVVDHQVSIFTFDGGVTAAHTMTAFSKEVYRDIKIHGTLAELVGNMEDNFIELRPFGGAVERVEIDKDSIKGNHGGGDTGLMHAIWCDFNGLPTFGMSYLDVSIDSHKMSFGAEQSRLSGKVVSIK